MRQTGTACRLLPLADGGDGSVSAAIAAGFVPVPVTVSGATGIRHHSLIGVDAQTAVVEVANVCGLPDGMLAPMIASSYGFGEALCAAVRVGCQRLVLALGGSASTDGGIGILAALGYRFMDRSGELLDPVGRHLSQIFRVDSSQAINLDRVQLVVAADVDSPLLGVSGAAAVFGPQKGATAWQVEQLEDGLASLVEAWERSGFATASQLAGAPGSGAAGGIGIAARLLGATFESGADFFLDLLPFDELAEDANLVITGEGRLDRQTLHGKLAAVVARRASPLPVLAVVGRNDLDPGAAAGTFADIIAVADLTDVDTATDAGLLVSSACHRA